MHALWCNVSAPGRVSKIISCSINKSKLHTGWCCGEGQAALRGRNAGCWDGGKAEGVEEFEEGGPTCPLS